ncbi:MAG: transposase [Reyranella sp.]|nr:transposase [Reyranella sp.]
MATVAVLSGPERRRRWSSSEKANIVEESLRPGAVVTAVARRHDVQLPTIAERSRLSHTSDTIRRDRWSLGT